MTEANLTATYREILTQPAAWSQAIERVESAGRQLTDLAGSGRYDRALLTGCGSTYYLAHATAAHFRQAMDISALAVPGGELWMNPRNAYPAGKRALLVAFSRSGTTSETIAAVRRFKKDSGGPVIVVTNYEDSPLAMLGDITIGIPEGQEISVAQTRSFASMYVAGVGLTFLLAGDSASFSSMERLPEVGIRLIASSENIARAVGENLALDRFYFLGSGPRYGLACEANLKMKEMSLTHSEPFHFLEFRHGPMSMAGTTTCMIGLLSEDNAPHERAVLEEMAAKGAQIFSMSEQNAGFNFNSGLPPAARNILYLPPLQFMALYRSLAKGLNPDRPENLTAVIELDIQ